MSLKRRDLLKGMSVAGAGTLLGGCAQSTPSGESQKRYNIIFVMTDDQTVDQMSCYGHPVLKTPNMDRLAENGTRFNHCLCTNSLCAPSRASVLTGCFSNINGIRGNTEKVGEEEVLNPVLPTFPEVLQDAGYQTGMIGKIHLDGDPRGFDDWRILPGQGSYFDPDFIENGTVTKNTGYVSDVITDKALDFLEKRDPGRPFLLVYQHKGPHRPYTPAPRHADLWADIPWPRPLTYDDNYATRMVSEKAEDMKFDVSLLQDFDNLPENASKQELKDWVFEHYVKDHYRAVYSIDENLGRVLRYLDDQDIYDDTIVIYTTDNGFFLGEHGWYDKRFMYEPSLHLPLVISHPGIGRPGQVSHDLVQNTDFAPTIIELAGLEVPTVMHGRSLKPILEGAAPIDWRKVAYYNYYENSYNTYKNMKPDEIADTTNVRYFNAHRVGAHRGVRTEFYKLIEFYTEDPVYWELFDLRMDPHEVRNVYGHPAYTEIQAELTDELRTMQRVYGTDDEGNLYPEARIS